MKPASWVIVNTARAINEKLYRAVPILEYLQSLNKAIK